MKQKDSILGKRTRREQWRCHAVRVTGVLAGVLLVLEMLYAQAPTAGLQGRVLNGTTNRPVPNIQVQYLLWQQGMVPVATATTDPEGRFRFESKEASGDAPALLRVEYQGATYSEPVLPPPNRADGVDIRVFEASREPRLMTVKEQIIFLHPAGDTLSVVEQIMLENRSDPPRSYVNPEGTYRFRLPGKPREEVRVSVEGPAGMRIPQAPVPQPSENSFAIAYPIRPGETEIRLEYALEYREPFDFSKPLDLVAERTHVVTPGKEVQVSGETLVPVGTDPATGFTGYQVTASENRIRLQVSGQAPAKSIAESAQAGEDSGRLVPIPDPVSQRRWIILALAGLVMLGGFVYHYTR